jgi:uncharacterized protein YajQ (UPF0234 family)
MNYPIKPSDINVIDHFWNAFNHSETEISARWLVRLAQKKGAWLDFTQEEINAFCEHDFHFNRLLTGLDNSPIKRNENGAFFFTHQFIATCFRSSPITEDIG